MYASVELADLAYFHCFVQGLELRSTQPCMIFHTRLQQEFKPFPRLSSTLLSARWQGRLCWGCFRLARFLSGFDDSFFKYWVLFLGFGVFAITSADSSKSMEHLGQVEEHSSLAARNRPKPAFSSLHKNDLPKLRLGLGKTRARFDDSHKDYRKSKRHS